MREIVAATDRLRWVIDGGVLLLVMKWANAESGTMVSGTGLTAAPVDVAS
jgi:hypothetical protein